MSAYTVSVLFSRGNVAAVNKPAGMVVWAPMLHDLGLQLWQLVHRHYPGSNTVHRIDRYTSGIVLAGLTRWTRGYLQHRWHQITKKIYLAIIRAPEWDEWTVNLPIDGKSAVTKFTILQRSSDGFALVQCELIQNGRRHQIRRHLQLIGYPIVGDRLYHGPVTTVRRGQLLHAWQLHVRLPDDSGQPGEWATIQAPIPPDFRTFKFDWTVIDQGASPTIETWPV